MNKKYSILLAAVLSTLMVACGEPSKDAKSDATTASNSSATQAVEKQASAPAVIDETVVRFESEGGGILKITPEEGDSEYALQFLKTGINPYSDDYKKDSIAAEEGRKIFLKYSCSSCHGPHGDGLSGPSITDERWNVARAGRSDKGMFELIAGGSANGMGAGRHRLVAKNPELLSTDDILKIVAWLRTQYKGPENTKTWEGQGVSQ